MNSDGNLCGWHLPQLENSEAIERRAKPKGLPTMNPRQKSTPHVKQDQVFQHFSDAAKYIDEYRKKNTVIKTGTELNAAITFPKMNNTEYSDQKLSKYIDIRDPEKKVCLTGLPHLKLSKNKVSKRAVQKTFTNRAHISDVPHLPRLKLNGVPKTVIERENVNRTDERKHGKNTDSMKRRKNPLPFFKPPTNAKDFKRFRTENNISFDFPVPQH